MKHLVTRAVLSAALVIATTPLAAFADTLVFQATGTGFESTGTLTTTPDANAGGVFDITGISGEVNGVAITSLLPGSYNASAPTNNGAFMYDNLLFNGPQEFDYNGVAFGLGSTGAQGNFYWDANRYEFVDVHGAVTALDSFTTSQTPEPSSLVLLGSGALGLVGMLRRRLMA